MSDYEFVVPKDSPEYFTNFARQLSQFLTNIDTKIGDIKKCFNDKIEVLTQTLRQEIKLVENKAGQALDLSLANDTAIKRMQLDISNMKRNNDGLVAENQRLTKQVDALESYGRRDNLVIRGIREQPGEDENACVEAVRRCMVEVLNLDREVVTKMVFSRCHRLGKNTDDVRFSRPVIVRFHNFNDRKRVWGQRFSITNKSYSISENYANNTEYRRRLFYPVVKKAKQSNTYKKVLLKGETLILDDKEYLIGGNESSLPPDLQLKQFSEKK